MSLDASVSSPLLINPESLTEASRQIREMDLAKAVGDALQAVYPGHLWTVSVDGGCVVVRNMALEGQWGFVLHAHRLVNEDMRKAVIKAGGELLERFNVSRGRAGVEDAQQILDVRHRAPWLKPGDRSR